MATGRTLTLEWAWQRQSVWSQTADALKSGPAMARGVRLGLMTASAAAVLAGSELKSVNKTVSVALAVASAVMLAGVGLLAKRQSVEEVRRWTRARSVSEAVKTEVFLFLTNSGAYGGSDREQRLDSEVQRLQNEASDLLAYTERVEPKDRALPAVHDLESYIDVRVRKSQLKSYYEPNARRLRRRLRVAKTVEVTLALIAAALAASTVISSDLGAWAAVVTTVSGAVAAHIAAERYEFLCVEYSRTASELRRLADRRTAADGHFLSGSELVEACERVISVQNQAWMAKWGEDTSGDTR